MRCFRRKFYRPTLFLSLLFYALPSLGFAAATIDIFELELGSLFFFVDNNEERNIPNYSRLDLRLDWEPTKRLELSLVGQNLFDETYPELSEGIERDSETERNFYIKGTLQKYF